ncbi:glutathione S-transferase [Shewanella sp. ULN5]|uniref:glutathione S-transferase n=1 Tax=Shewanella sp. ULN5 TaxID=2994678 RepID=UPI00273FEB16|nr:glutathione S-transferase [Shewanella sp. ULN5]MDP5148085.1 glutathione S-transferase [Shewanella sp. ULN5]
MIMNHLYSFRRCPYAMRARTGLHLSVLNPEVREIILKNKPAEMLAISPKGTVPVLVYSDQVIAESLDIFQFALKQYPQQNCPYLNKDQYQTLIESLDSKDAKSLIQQNDVVFKPWLDKYKYADRHPEMSQFAYRQQAELFIDHLEQQLSQDAFLFTNHPTFADYAIFPFIRQFAGVDPSWFASCPYPKVRAWLNSLIESELFKQVMTKYPLWLDDKRTIHLKW